MLKIELDDNCTASYVFIKTDDMIRQINILKTYQAKYWMINQVSYSRNNSLQCLVDCINCDT